MLSFIFANMPSVLRPYINLKLISLFSILVFCSCQNNSDSVGKTTWIGGEIVNPKLDYVIMFKDDCVLDTIKLNNDNFFLFESTDIKEGLYSFQHHEYQVFYINPGDSLMLRVNTVDFDESLTYSGDGAGRNNFLIEMFLLNEAENRLMPEMYLLPPEDFQKKLDSLKSIRTDLYEDFVVKYRPNKTFKEIALANINYDFFSKKELYTSATSGNKKFMEEHTFPDDFYEYRNEIDLGNENLRSYYPYYRFLNRYFDNLAFEKYKGSEYFNRGSFAHVYNKVTIIDSLITDEFLKNSMLRTNVGRYLFNAKDAKGQNIMMDLFLDINTNESHRVEIQKLADATLKLTKNNTIPNVFLLTTDNTVKDLHSIIKRPTVFYFWSSESIMHYKNIHKRASELQEKYPKYDFIGLNTDRNRVNWRSIVKASGYDPLKEYQFEDIEDAERKLVINWVNKTIVVNKNGLILEGNTNLFNKQIEHQLLGYLHK